MFSHRTLSSLCRVCMLVPSALMVVVASGCASFDENDGIRISTTPDQQLEESMFFGKC